MTRRYWYIAAMIVTVFAILAGGRYAGHAPSAANSTQSAAVATNGSSSKISGFHMPTSADKVHVTAWISPVRGASTSSSVLVRLDIRKGWHVNANPASLPFLIPTSEKATINGKAAALDITYPRGRNSHIVLEGTAIRVYDDATVLKASIPKETLARLKSTGSLVLVVTVQSCSNKGICLPPVTLTSDLSYHS